MHFIIQATGSMSYKCWQNLAYASNIATFRAEQPDTTLLGVQK